MHTSFKHKAFGFLKSLLPYGVRQRVKRSLFHVKDMPARLANLRQAGFVCTGAVDGGAFEGEWTIQLWDVYPEAPSMLVEPQPSKAEALLEVSRRVRGSRYIQAALGRVQGMARLTLSGTNSSLLGGSGADDDETILTVPVIPLDALLIESPEFRPNLLKLDLQGYELECLEGCQRHLVQFEVIVLEVSIIPIGGAPRFSDVNLFLEHAGFQLYDILPQYYRPLDGALWQCDAFYVRKDSSLIQSMEWA